MIACPRPGRIGHGKKHSCDMPDLMRICADGKQRKCPRIHLVTEIVSRQKPTLNNLTGGSDSLAAHVSLTC